jgi:hypothetical protein
VRNRQTRTWAGLRMNPTEKIQGVRAKRKWEQKTGKGALPLQENTRVGTKSPCPLGAPKERKLSHRSSRTKEQKSTEKQTAARKTRRRRQTTNGENQHKKKKRCTNRTNLNTKAISPRSGGIIEKSTLGKSRCTTGYKNQNFLLTSTRFTTDPRRSPPCLPHLI